MAESVTDRIDRDRLDEPHIRGRRISVRAIHEYVEGRGLDPATVADRLDLDLADVYRALAFYHDHRTEMQEIETTRDAILEDVRMEAGTHRPADVEPG